MKKNNRPAGRQGIKFLFITLFFLLTSLISFSIVKAETSDLELDPYGYGVMSESNLGDRDPRSTTTSIINISLTLIGTVCTGLIIYAGYLWMTAGGNDDQVGKAKKIIIAAIIGAIIVFISYAISNFVLKSAYESSQGKPYGGRQLF